MKPFLVQRFTPVVLALLFLSACGEKETLDLGECAGGATSATGGPDAALARRGGAIYKQHCARCHGANAAGAPNWHQPDVAGRYPPPPLDGSAHAWHHPKAVLKQMIRDGIPRDDGGMPAWGGKLSEADIEAVIAWFQSRWPDEIYRNWLAIEAQATCPDKGRNG